MRHAALKFLNAVHAEPGSLSQRLLRQSGRQTAFSQQISKGGSDRAVGDRSPLDASNARRWPAQSSTAHTLCRVPMRPGVAGSGFAQPHPSLSRHLRCCPARGLQDFARLRHGRLEHVSAPAITGAEARLDFVITGQVVGLRAYATAWSSDIA